MKRACLQQNILPFSTFSFHVKILCVTIYQILKHKYLQIKKQIFLHYKLITLLLRLQLKLKYKNS